MLNLGEGKVMESPLSAFNNLLIQISDKIERIYIPDKKTKNILFINQLLFEEKSITICNCIKIMYENNEIGFRFYGLYINTEFIQISINNKKELFEIFQNYLYVISTITQNFDEDISQKQVQSIFDQVMDKKTNPNQMFLVPYKNKILRLYDNYEPDNTLDKIFYRFSYVLKFYESDKASFKYSICRCLSTILNEAKSLENIRFEDIEIIKSDTVSIGKLKQFLIDLYYYGEIN